MQRAARLGFDVGGEGRMIQRQQERRGNRRGKPKVGADIAQPMRVADFEGLVVEGHRRHLFGSDVTLYA